MKFCWKIGKMAGYATISIGETAFISDISVVLPSYK
jgi:hypothetical protein